MTLVAISVKHFKEFLYNFEHLQRNGNLSKILKAPHYHSLCSFYNTHYDLKNYLDIAQNIQVEYNIIPGFYKIVNCDPLLVD